jgi:hypothetical protein
MAALGISMFSVYDIIWIVGIIIAFCVFVGIVGWMDRKTGRVPDNYWENMDNYLKNRPELPKEPEDDDPNPMI